LRSTKAHGYLFFIEDTARASVDSFWFSQLQQPRVTYALYTLTRYIYFISRQWYFVWCPRFVREIALYSAGCPHRCHLNFIDSSPSRPRYSTFVQSFFAFTRLTPASGLFVLADGTSENVRCHFAARVPRGI
jgi:hypothetical protein